MKQRRQQSIEDVTHTAGQTTSVPRCVLDRERPRRVSGPRSQVCQAHRDQLAEMLDPTQVGQIFTAPGERRVAASIPVLYSWLPYLPGAVRRDCPVRSSVFRSMPPGDMTAAVHRDPRSEIGGQGRDDAEYDAGLSVLGTLGALAQRLDLLDVDGRPVTWPKSVPLLAQWLYYRLPELCAVDWVGDAYGALRQLHRELRSAAGDPVPRPLGGCRKRVDDDGHLDPTGPWECGMPLYLPPQALRGMDEPVRFPDRLDCRACGGSYTAAEMIQLGVGDRLRKASA